MDSKFYKRDGQHYWVEDLGHGQGQMHVDLIAGGKFVSTSVDGPPADYDIVRSVAIQLQMAATLKAAS